MADPVLKFPQGEKAPAGTVARTLMQRLQERRRTLLLVVVPLIAVIVGLAVYLTGGRYVTTDNAYVGAQKVLIAADIAGKVNKVTVREGQRVSVNDVLFEFDAEPFRLALQQAQARLETVRSDFANLKSNDAALTKLIELGEQNVDLKQKDVERKSTLIQNKAGSEINLDASAAALNTAQNQLELLRQQRANLRNQLLGEPDLPIEKFPAFMQARAALDQAARDLNHTVVRAPIAGRATQVDNIQIGRYVTAGTPIFAVVDDSRPWIDANPKETEFTWLREGQKVTIDVDAFPNHTFRGTVTSLSPGTGAQFAILPPQNASGNWIKVVQRVPIRITFDADEQTQNLRAGMSAAVSIDTGRKRSLATLIGLSSATADTK
jgi:membrane fusion protein (multidrug efflux system)